MRVLRVGCCVCDVWAVQCLCNGSAMGVQWACNGRVEHVVCAWCAGSVQGAPCDCAVRACVVLRVSHVSCMCGVCHGRAMGVQGAECGACCECVLRVF